MAAPTEWNSLVPAKNRLESPNYNRRKAGAATPTHIVLHITGADKFIAVKKLFMAEHSVSAHYLVTPDGALYQFVPDKYRAWHAGIESSVRRLYKMGRPTWQQHMRYFSWYKAYPKDARYVDQDLEPVWEKGDAFFVAQQDGKPLPEYAYFNSRWPGRDVPVNFDVDPDPNNYSIGIEILGFGAKKADPKAYTPAMYASLRALVTDLSNKYAIPMKKGRVVAHEDVNPVARWGWDPNQGFDWKSVYK